MTNIANNKPFKVAVVDPATGDPIKLPTTFLELSDTPSDYTGQAGRVLQVNATADGLEFGSGISGGLIFKGAISIPADFPTLAEVETGWFYTITAEVTDNDPTRTNTGLSFVIGDEIAWNGSTWIVIGNELRGLQQSYDIGNNIITDGRPLWIENSGSNYNGTNSSLKSYQGSDGTQINQVFNHEINALPNVVFTSLIFGDLAVTFPASDQIETGIDLTTLDNPPGVAGTTTFFFNSTIVVVKDADVAGDIKEYFCVGLANGTTTNSRMILIDPTTGSPANFTSTTATVIAVNQAGLFNTPGSATDGPSNAMIMTAGQGNSDTDLYALFNDSGTIANMMSITNAGNVGGAMLSLRNYGPGVGLSADVPYIEMGGFGIPDAGDIHFSARNVDPTTEETYAGDTIAFSNNAPAQDTITTTGPSFLDAGFKPETDIVVSGSASNDGQYRIEEVTATTITLTDPGVLTNESSGATVTLTDRVLPFGAFWYRYDLSAFSYWDGSSIQRIGTGGAVSLQDAYLNGEYIKITPGHTGVFIDGSNSTYDYTGIFTTSFIDGIRGYMDVNPASGGGPKGNLNWVRLAEDESFTVTAPDTIQFNNTVDLLALGAGVASVSSNGNYCWIFINNTDIYPTDCSAYVVTSVSSAGGGTNNVCTLLVPGGGAASLTASSGNAHITNFIKSDQMTGTQKIATPDNSLISGSQGTYYSVANDGGDYDTVFNVSNYPAYGSTPAKIDDQIASIFNYDNTGAADVPLLRFYNLGNHGDIKFTPRSTDPTGLGAGDLGTIWYRAGSLYLWDGTQVKGVASLQAAYDGGNQITVGSKPIIISSATGPQAAYGNIGGFIQFTDTTNAAIGTLRGQSGPPSEIGMLEILNDSAVTLSGDQITFDIAIDLISLGAGVSGVNTSFDWSGIILKSTDASPTDEGYYTIVGISSSGGGTNNVAQVTTFGGGVPTFTATTGNAQVSNIQKNTYQAGELMVATPSDNLGGALYNLWVDGGTVGQLMAITNLADGTVTDSLLTMTNAGTGDVPLLKFNNQQDAGDIRFTNRASDPTNLNDGEIWYNTSDNKLRHTDGTNKYTLLSTTSTGVAYRAIPFGTSDNFVTSDITGLSYNVTNGRMSIGMDSSGALARLHIRDADITSSADLLRCDEYIDVGGVPTLRNRFLVADGGLVGIQNGNPQSMLHVKGNFTFGINYLAIGGPDNGGIIEGRVGIGTSAPSSAYQLTINNISGVNGGILSQTSGAGTAITGTSATGTAAAFSSLGTSISTYSVEVNPANGASGIYVNSTSGYGIVVEVGNVGIGVTAPNEALEVAGKIRSNAGFNVNGTDGLTGTYSFGGGGSGDIATMSFTGGILTAVTLVP